MLITLECVILALQAVAAVRLALHSPIEITSPSNNRLSKRSPVELGDDIRKCYTMKVNANGVDLNLRVDSGVSDIMVPLPSSSNDIGLAIQSIPGGELVTINYRDKEYSGFSSDTDVTIPGTSITGINLPVIAVERQSADSVGISSNLDGVFGFGYSSFSKHHPPITAMDILYKDGIIPNNEIGLQLCPYDILHESFINIGNTDITAKCGTDGSSVAWVQSPTNDQFTINIKSILINDEQVELPAEFQKRVEDGHTLYSFIQTCSAYMYLPKTVVATLINDILDSGAIRVKGILFRNKLGKIMLKSILQGNYIMPKSEFKIKWEKLPSFTIVMFAQNPVTVNNYNSVVTIKLGPRDYIQKTDSDEFLFTVTAGPNNNAALGIPFMTRLEVTFDRQNQRIGFGPGCGCEVMADGYPTISNSNQVLWPLTQLPEQPSTSSSSGRSTLRRSLSRLGSIRRDSRRPKMAYKDSDGYWPLN